MQDVRDNDLAGDTGRYTLDPTNKPKMVTDAVRGAKSLRGRWLKNAHEGDNFFAGHQWNEEDEEYLRSQGRPAVTFNRILKTLMLVVGVEINHRQDPLAIARNPYMPGQKELAELTTTYMRWVLDNCEGDEERTMAFLDLLKRGMGWEELSLAYDVNPDGEILLTRVDGLEMWWDPAAKSQNLKDARWVARRRFMPYEEIVMLFGEDKAADVRDAADQDPDEEPELVVNVSPIGYAPGNSKQFPSGKHPGPYIVSQFQWWQWEKYYRALDPETIDPNNPEAAKIVNIPADQWARFQKLSAAHGHPNPIGHTAQRRAYWQTFTSGDVELDSMKLPVNDFTLMCMTGLRDEKNHVFFGMVRPMKDPQEWANKFFSQTMDLLNRSRKNALLLRKGAADDVRKFEKDINSSGAVALMNDTSEAAVRELTSTQMPAALPYLLEHSLAAIPDVSGINVELLGQSQGDQPGITTQYRQTQGLTVMAPFFNAERRLRLKESRLLIEYGRRYIADGRLMILGGSATAPAIPLFREQIATDYNLVLDENPRNPNMKMAMWTELIPVLQIAIKAGLFGLIAKIFDYAPYPESIITEIQKELQSLEQQKQQNPMGAGGGKHNPMLDMAKMAKLQSASQVDLARARALDAASKLKGFELGVDTAKTIADMHRAHREHTGNMHQRGQRMRHDEQSHYLDQLGSALEILQGH